MKRGGCTRGFGYHVKTMDKVLLALNATSHASAQSEMVLTSADCVGAVHNNV